MIYDVVLLLSYVLYVSFEDETSLRGVECKTPYFHMPRIVSCLICAVVVIVAQVEN